MVVGKWWLRSAVTATLLAMLPCAVIAQSTPTSAAADNASNLSPEQLADQIENDLRGKLTSPRSTAADRDEAAKRLLAYQTSSAKDVLLNALKAPGTAAHDQRLAVAKAIADAPASDTRFVSVLESMLAPDRPPTEPAAAAAALVRFSDADVQKRLLDFAGDARQPAASREAAVRALGNLALLTRDIADRLVFLASDGAQPQAIRDGAMDALADCTGLPYGHDPARWRQWINAAPKDDTAWTAQVAAGHAAHEQQLVREKDAYAKALEGIINDQMQQMLRANRNPERGQLMLRMLTDADPHARVLGISYCTNAFARGQFFPRPDADDRIQDLLGDSNTDVRLAAARAIQELNLVKALDLILAQLVHEPNADVRETMAGALGRIKSLRAVPTLQRLLNDPSMRVKVAAANSLGELAAQIRASNPQQADQVGDELWNAQYRAGRDRESIAFRAACIETIGKLSATKPVQSILRIGEQPQEPLDLRLAAFHALGATHDRRVSPAIARALVNENTNNKEVRLAEIQALADTGKFEEDASFLHELILPTEPDAAVRNAAWEAFKKLLPTATDMPTLKEWSDRLKADPLRQLTVLDTLTQKLKDANNMEGWAMEEQNRGEVLLLKLNHPDQAATAFEAALDYWTKAKAQNVQVIRLVRQLMDALLKSRNYEKACAFAAEQIRSNPGRTRDVGPMIRECVERLVAEGNAGGDQRKLRDAVQLIDLAEAIDPPLEKAVLSDLAQLKLDAERATKRPATSGQ
jgi:HEAT repeat protein